LAGDAPGSPPPPSPAATEPLEAQVRTEPEGLEVSLDGVALKGSTVRFSASPPHGVLSVRSGCRLLQRGLSPADAGRTVVLVPDATRQQVVVDPGVQGARVGVNDAAEVRAPAAIDLDLCRENVVTVSAPGYRPATVRVPADATPLAARTAVAGMKLGALPVGTLVLPRFDFEVDYTVDGSPVRGRELRLPEGRHQVRAVNEALWLDLTTEVEVRGGEVTRARIEGAELGELVVQAFPANCRVHVRRSSRDPWRLVDDTPLRRSVVVGTYLVRVTFVPTGEVREREVALSVGENPPVRVAFGSGA
jgi:hypothetical protein